MDFQRSLFTTDQSKPSSLGEFPNAQFKPLPTQQLNSLFTTLPTQCSPLHRTQLGLSNSCQFSFSPRNLQKDLEKVRFQLTGVPTLATLEDQLETARTDLPQLRWCAYCGCQRTASIRFKKSAKTFWSAVAIFLMGGVLGCFMAPYMIDSCKQPEFVCEKCEHPIN